MKFHLNFNLLVSISILFTMAITSCGDIQQDLYIKKDGSGTLETTIDVGELMSMAKGFEDMGAAQDTFSDDTMPDFTITPQPEAPKDAMTLLMERVTDPSHNQDFDTMMSMLSIMPDSLKEKETRTDLMEKIFVRVKSPANSADLTFGIVMNFDNTKQLREIINYMENLNQSSEMMSGAAPMGMDSENFLAFDADMKAGWIKVDTFSYAGLATQMGMSQDSAISSEDLGMVEMMFGNSKIKTVIHVPGEVLSCTNPEAILTKDNKVIVEYPMMDVIRKGTINGFTVHFKP